MAPHVVLLPFAGSGRLHPFMVFANKLASLGCLVSFVVPADRLLQATRAYNSKAHQNPQIHLHVLDPDALDDDKKATQRRVHDTFTSLASAVFRTLEESVPPKFEKLFQEISEKHSKPCCIVTCEVALSVVHETAKRHHVPHWVLFPTATTPACVMCHMKTLIESGSLPLESTEEMCVPGLDFLPGRDEKGGIISMLLTQERKSERFDQNMILLHECSGWLMNSFEEIEPRAFAALRLPELNRNLVPVLQVGPLVPENSTDDDNIEPLDKEVLDFLDKQSLKSVIYVSFGSVVVPSKEQVVEIYRGLQASQKPFLWMINTEVLQDVLPEGHMDENGLITNKWVSQTRILSHPSVGLFFTHCGWNSTLESLVYGVPVLALPSFADQFNNCWVLVEQVKMGKRMDLPVESGQVCDYIKELMEDDNVKAHVADARSMALEALDASRLNIKQWISQSA